MKKTLLSLGTLASAVAPVAAVVACGSTTNSDGTVTLTLNSTEVNTLITELRTITGDEQLFKEGLPKSATITAKVDFISDPINFEFKGSFMSDSAHAFKVVELTGTEHQFTNGAELHFTIQGSQAKNGIKTFKIKTFKGTDNLDHEISNAALEKIVSAFMTKTEEAKVAAGFQVRIDASSMTGDQLSDKILDLSGLQVKEGFWNLIELKSDQMGLTDASKEKMLKYFGKIKPINIKLTNGNDSYEFKLDVSDEVNTIVNEIKANHYFDFTKATYQDIKNDNILQDNITANNFASAVTTVSTHYSSQDDFAILSSMSATMSMTASIKMATTGVLSEISWKSYLKELGKIHEEFKKLKESTFFKKWNASKEYNVMTTDLGLGGVVPITYNSGQGWDICGHMIDNGSGTMIADPDAATFNTAMNTTHVLQYDPKNISSSEEAGFKKLQEGISNIEARFIVKLLGLDLPVTR